MSSDSIRLKEFFTINQDKMSSEHIMSERILYEMVKGNFCYDEKDFIL